MAFELIQIGEFEQTSEVSGAGEEFIVVRKADGKTYKMSTADFKAFLGTVQIQVPKALAPTDPAPTLSSVYYPTVTQNEAGTPIVYANAGGIEVNTAEGGADHNSMVQLIYDGSSWVKVNVPIEVDTSELIPKTAIVNDVNTGGVQNVPSAEAVKGLANQVDSYSERVFPEGVETSIIDRPDLDLGGLVFVNQDMYELGGTSVNPQPTPDPTLDETINYIQIPEQPAFEGYVNPDDFASKFDLIRTDNLGSPSFNPYITRTIVGKSTEGNYNVYRWDFKPDNPKCKIIVFGGIHASEKVFPESLTRMFRYLVENWPTSVSMEWVRQNVHIICVPLLSTYSVTLSENGNLDNPPTGYGYRLVNETAPFTVNWTRSGTTLTVTINPATFPTTNPNISPENYIKPGALNKLLIRLIESSDLTAVPNGNYLFLTQTGTYSYTTTVPNAGATSGTVRLQVRLDPNRNFNSDSPTWDSIDATTITFNKGSKPFSINETVIYKNIVEANLDALFILSFHNGQGRYQTFKPSALDGSLFTDVNRLEAAFTTSAIGFLSSDNISDASQWAYSVHGIPSFTPEFDWADREDPTGKAPTESMRWALNLVCNLTRLYYLQSLNQK